MLCYKLNTKRVDNCCNIVYELYGVYIIFIYIREIQIVHIRSENQSASSIAGAAVMS